MKLTKEYVNDVCKIGQREQCCRYLLFGADGFECGKMGPLKEVIDSKVMYMSAQANNCEGVNNREEEK